MLERLLKLLGPLIGGSERFRSNLLGLAGASALGHLIQLLALPILTRIFSPQDFGVLAVYAATQSILLSVATGRFDWSVPNTSNRGTAIALIGLGLCGLAVSCLSLVLVLIFFGYPLATKIGFTETHGNLVFLLPLGLFAGGLQLLFQAWFVYQGTLRTISLSRLAHSSANVVLSLGFGVVAYGAAGLVFSNIGALCVAAGVLIVGQKSLLASLRRLSSRQLLSIFQSHMREAGFSILVGLTNTLSHMSVIFLIAAFYGETVVGWYALVYRLGTAPIAFLTSAIAYSFWADAAKLAMKDADELWSFYISTIRRLGFFSLLLSPFFIGGPLYIPIIFGGEEWVGAGILMAAVAPLLMFLVVFSPTTHLIVYGKQHWQFACDFFTLAALLITFVTLAKLGYSAAVAIFVSSLVMAGGYLIRFLAHYHANRLLAHELSRAQPTMPPSSPT